MQPHAIRLGLVIIGLAFLGDDLFLPALGHVAARFGVGDATVQAYGLVPYYGFAASGFVHAALAGRMPLGAILAAGLVAAALSNLAILVTRALLGGTGLFEAHAVDIGPRAEGPAAIQRSLLQIAATSLVALFVAMAARLAGDGAPFQALLTGTLPGLCLLQSAAWFGSRFRAARRPRTGHAGGGKILCGEDQDRSRLTG